MKASGRISILLAFILCLPLAGCAQVASFVATVVPTVQPGGANVPVKTVVSAFPAVTVIPPPTLMASATAEPTATTPPTVEPTYPAYNTALFAEGSACASCHNGMVDGAGQDISFGKLWGGSLHANAARDPYFHATVRAEVEQHPELRPVIESTCAGCHMPMAEITSKAAQVQGLALDEGFYSQKHPLHGLALDGISCTLCHQLQPAALETELSYNGGNLVDLGKGFGERVIFGPFLPVPQGVEAMKLASGFVPTQGNLVLRPELCGSCHTLHTPVVNAAGTLQRKTFPEQMQFAEWKASSYAGQITCQACHMPRAAGGIKLSADGTGKLHSARAHSFLGGNSYMLNLLASDQGDLEVSAPADLKAAAQRDQDFLQQQAAKLYVSAAQNGDTLQVTVRVVNKAGHKFPSGFPARRAWLHLTVTDGAGKVVFESGPVDADGKIAGNDNDQDPATFEPHYDRINDPAQVQIYEAILGNTDGEVTTDLLRSASYLKDNRLLPAGFNSAIADPEIATVGAAAEDQTFTGGADTVTYQAALGGAGGPYQVSVQLLFQPIGYRWAENLVGEKSAESEMFMKYELANPLTPVVVAEVEVVK